GWQVLVEACRRIKPVFVVIDTQARVTVGMEENSAKEMGVFIEAAERIRQATGACVGVVHHTGRAGGDARGSSAIDGAQSTELKVVRQDALTGVLKVEKQKDLPEREDMPLFFQSVSLGQDGDGDEVTSLVLLESNTFRAAAGAGTPEPRIYVPTFHDKDVWRQRILDALYLHAPSGGWTLTDLVRRLATDFEIEERTLRRNGAFTGAWKAMLALTDDDGEMVIGRPTPQRFEIGSLSARAGLAARYPDQ
ncbi:MAG TPA: AAA family ATPase, partial [Steroidobacteraceae bacterium]